MAKVLERKRSKHYLRSAKGIKVGDKFTYVSQGFEIYEDGQKIVVSKGVEYDAEVIQVTEHLITLNLIADQTTIPRSRPCIWESRPYNWSIRKCDIGVTEKLYLYA